MQNSLIRVTLSMKRHAPEQDPRGSRSINRHESLNPVAGITIDTSSRAARHTGAIRFTGFGKVSQSLHDECWPLHILVGRSLW